MATNTSLPDPVAACSVTGATGVATAAKGCTVARTGAGVYTVTLDTPMNSADCFIMVCIKGAAAAFATYAHTSDTVKAVTTFTTAFAAGDFNWDFACFRRL